MVASGQQEWRAALRKLSIVLLPYEIKTIESKIDADVRLQKETEEGSAEAGQNLLRLANVFKPYVLPQPQPGNIAEMRSYNDLMKEIDIRVYEKLMLLEKLEEQKKPTMPMPDFFGLLDWLPPEDNPYSLGRDGSTRVDRIKANIFDIGLDGFSAFWANNEQTILQSMPKDCLLQVVTDESDNVKMESYQRQREFLVELAKAIARARGVNVDISWGTRGSEDVAFEGSYYRRPDSFFKVGDRFGSIELKTKGEDDTRKIAVARGQVVIMGNTLWRMRTRVEPFHSFYNEVYGFVGNGIQLQCLRQIHAYKTRVRAYDGPLLQLAGGDYKPGDTFEIDLSSAALKWAAAALDRMVVTEAERLKAHSEVNKDVSQRDYGRLKLMASGGYWIGNEYLQVACKAPFKECLVTVVGATRNNEMSVVLRVLWEGDVWWLKVGPDMEFRQKALQAPDELPTGGWERWFQTERDMLSRGLLNELGGAFAVSIEGVNRPAMLVKDAGDSVEKQLFSRQMTPVEVYEMSKQLYVILEDSAEHGVIHGDVSLENICYKESLYSLIDWGLACGRPFFDLAAAVDKAWPGLDVTERVPGIPNWEMSPDCCFCGMRPYDGRHDMESLLYCCMKILGGSTLPWSVAACSGTEFEVLQLRTATVTSFVKAQGHFYEPLVRKLGRTFTKLPSVEEHRSDESAQTGYS